MGNRKGIKFAIVFIAILLIANTAFGYKLPTEKQLNELCIPVVMKIDNDVHWFYWKHIISFDETGFRVKFGKNLSQEAFYPESEIINLYTAIKRFEEIKEKNQ